MHAPWFFGSIPSNYGDVEPCLARVVRDAGVSNALVFIAGVDRLPRGTNNDLDNDFCATGFAMNSVDFDGDVVYARSWEGQNHRLAAFYPDRGYYLSIATTGPTTGADCSA